MFDYSKMLKRAIEFFPQWSDIRKRYKTSTGGRFLSSMLEESLKTEEAIQEYIDSYFLYNYIGHEDEVMAFVYMANVGMIDDISTVKVFYNNEWYFFEEDIKRFEKEKRYVFYEDGKIYLKVNDYIEGIDTIQLFIDESLSNYPIKFTHVWNIFDEFATFVNTRRYENETNKQLLDRILYITRNLPNGTESGLKHAIISELMFDCPDITMDDIKIEGPTPENLMKAYEDYETLLDMLVDVNRDVFRAKRWDIDSWEYRFESISYIPHVWDKVIKEWQNGVGSFDDLEVILADNSSTTDATIYFYKKTLEAFQKYIYDKYIETDIHFTLTRYNNILNSTNVIYKIQASELRDVTNEEIYLKAYESNKQTTEIPIQDIISGWGRNVVTIKNNEKDENDRNDYKLEFKTKTGYDLIINKADVLYIDKDTQENVAILNLLDREDPGFVTNSEYELVSTANKMTINAVEHFSECIGLKNDDGTITLDDGFSEGRGTVSLTNKAGLYVNCDYECQTVELPRTAVSSMGGYWNDNDEFVVRGDYSMENKTVKIVTMANYLSFKMPDENINADMDLTIEDEVFGTSTIEIEELLDFKSELTETPRKITITITILSNDDVKFKDFRYSNYSVLLDAKYGSLEKTDKGYKLGNFYNNELKLTVMAKTGCCPIIKGIYIGEDFANISYRTNPIRSMDNCIRIFDIKTNGIINLIRLDEYGTEVEVVEEDYKPMVQYQATSDDAYIRIDLSDYDSIDETYLDAGCNLEVLEESGVFVYNIRLTAGQIVSTITVKGSKAVEARVMRLIDLVKVYVKDFNVTYDKIYCCKCSKGLVIGRQNPGGTPYNELIEIGSEALSGINAIKYTMVLPPDLGTIYGTSEGGETRSNTTTFRFDYISIYPESSQVYQARNEFETCIRENRYIKIINNFSPVLNTNKLLFYSVELFDESISNEDLVVRFHSDTTAEEDIYDLPSWSIGTSNSYIAIQNNIDMLNDISYSMTTYNIDDKGFLSSTIDIKDSYTLTDHTILNTEKFIVDTENEHVTVKFDRYDGTDKKSHLLKYEEIVVESDGFNKLVYSNIDTIYHISRTPFTTEYIEDDVEYTILKDQGIIVWNDAELINKNIKMFLVYSIKKPIAFVYDLEYLYNAVDFDTDAYGLVSERDLVEQEHETRIDLKSYKDYEEADLVYVSCTNPTFQAQLEGDFITFNKYTKKNVLLVKTGYYYINGREYYLFSEENPEDVKNNKLYSANNVDISGGEMTTYKATNNYVANSEMRLKAMAELYNFDCDEPLTYGISAFNNLTSCESFNDWNTFGMELKLVDGLNGAGLYFTPQIENGYAFIDITDHLSEDVLNYVSFHASDKIKTYLGFEENYLYINFNRVLNITVDREIEYDNSNIRDVVVNKLPNHRYYIIVQSEGTVDDIVISTDPDSVYTAHVKNIDLIGFDLYEKRTEGSRYRMMINSNKDYKPYLAGLMSDGSFKTTSNIDWYITQIFGLEEDEDFRQCKLENIGVDAKYIYTTAKEGHLETQPIYIGDIDNVKRLIFKINNISFTNMRNFDVVVETCDKYNGTYIPCNATFRSNKFYIDQRNLKSYIRVKVTMPPYKYIDCINIFAEYTSTNDDPLQIITKHTGYIESKVYDLQEITNCFVKSIDIEDIGNINDVNIYIRSSKDVERLDVWDDWHEIKFNDDLKIIKTVDFTNVRFLQFKIVLKNREAFIKLKGIDIEIK